MSLKRLSAPAVSPDGRKLCYAVEKINVAENRGNKDLVVQALNGQPVQITSTPFSEHSPQWSSDGKAIYFLSSEGGSAQVWMMRDDGSSKKQITNLPAGVSAFQIHEKASRILVLSDVQTTRDVNAIYPDLPQTKARIVDDLFYRHWDSWDDFQSTHLFAGFFNATEFTSANWIDLQGTDPYDVQHFSLSPSGLLLAMVMKKETGKDAAFSTNTDVFLHDFKTSRTINVSDGMLGYDQHPVFSAQSDWLLWESMKEAGYESDKASIIRYNIEKRSAENMSLDFSEGAENLVFSADAKTIWFTSPDKGSVQIFALDAASGKIKALTKGEQDFNSLASCAEGLVALRSTISSPNEVYLVSAADGSLSNLSKINKEVLGGIEMGKVEAHWVTTTDNKKMLVWHVLPPNFDPAKKYPTLLYCQGGPQSMVSNFFSYRWNLQLMASQGYLVVAPNRRGLPGFGKVWNDTIARDWGGQAMQDYLSAIDDAAKLPYVDSTRLGAVGASYGGYSVYWLAGNHNKRFKSFIAHCGLFNLESWFTVTEEMFFAMHDLGGPYWEDEFSPEYERFSPHRFVRNWDTPILVIHGENDFRVPVGEGMQAFGVAQNKGIKSRFLYFPDEGHWVMKPQNSVLWHREFFRWLDETLKQ